METALTACWTELFDYVKEWFYQPDLEAIEIALAACYCHPIMSGDPIWLFFIGPASTGKTVTIINACAAAADSVVVGDLGPDTLLSAWQDGKKGLLSRHPNPIFLFKDFSTFLSKRQEQRREIEGQLREVYDGYFRKDRGVGYVEWSGKATVIAATTPAIDRYWGFERELGERFLSVRMNVPDPLEAAGFSLKQRGFEKEIAATVKAHAKAILDIPVTLNKAWFSDDQKKELSALSLWLARMRTSTWHYPGEKELSTSEPESPMRAMKVLSLLCRTQAVMHQLPELSTRWARRVAFDSAPRNRLMVFESIPPNSAETIQDIADKYETHRTAVKRAIDEMAALNLIRDRGIDGWGFTQKFYDLCRRSKLPGFEDEFKA